MYKYLKQQMSSSYIFGSCRHSDAAPDNPTNSTHTQLLSLIASHPSFKSKINSFIDLFPSGLTSEGLIKLGTMVYALLFPDFPKAMQRQMAVELFNFLQTHPDEVTYTNLTEYLLKICSDLVENIDVRSAIGVLDLIQSRIVDYFVIDVVDSGYKHKIPINMKL